jgi:hypothetical protein
VNETPPRTDTDEPGCREAEKQRSREAEVVMSHGLGACWTVGPRRNRNRFVGVAFLARVTYGDNTHRETFRCG